MRWLALLAVFLLFGCAVPLQDGAEPRLPDPEEPAVRPDIPRSPPPGDEPAFRDAGEQPTPRQIFINGTARAPAVALEVPLGDAIGQHHARLTATQFPLLRHRPIVLHGATVVEYTEELRFDFGANSTGRVVFTKDDTDRISTYLLFEEGKPILEYRLHLLRGTWQDVQGRDIQVLGHTYVVAEATNRTVNLYGRDIDSNLAFTNGSRLVVNSSAQSDTRVTVGPDLITFTLYADDLDEGGILLGPGEGLAERIGQNRLGSRILNLRFAGAPEQVASLVMLDKTKFGYDLVVDTVYGKLEIPLVEQDAGTLVLGTVDAPMRIAACPSGVYCIPPGTQVLLTRGGKTFLLEYSDAANETKELIMRSAGNRYSYEFLGEPGRDAFADILIGGERFRARIGPKDNATGEHNISIEQAFLGVAEIAVLGGFHLRIHDVNGTTLPLELITPQRTGEERTWLNISYNGRWTIAAGGNVTFVEEDGGDILGITGYGTAVYLERDRSGLARNQGEEAVVLIPLREKHAVVLVEG